MSQFFTLFPALALTPLSLGLSVLGGLLFALAGGAAAGIKIGGADLGKEMAGMMGALYGATSAVPAVIIGLIVLAFI